MNPEKAIDLLKQLFQACPGIPEWREDGKLSLKVGATGLPWSLLDDLEEEEITSQADGSRVGPLPPGATLVLATVNLVGKIVLARDIESLLKVRKAEMKEPRAYVVWHEGSPVYHVESESTEQLPEILRSYHEAIKLWGLLREYAHHFDETKDSLLYFGIRRTEIAAGFKAEDLATGVDISEVVDFMSETDARETRKEIFLSRIAEHLRDQEPARRFPFLLGSLKRFARGLREAMAIYLCEHSPEKLAEEAAKAAVDYTEKLEKIVSGLEAKSLTVPVALLFAYKEIEPCGNTWNNMVILVSTAIYLVTMCWIWCTQSSLLHLLEQGMRGKVKDLKHKGLEASNPVLQDTFTKLFDRLWWANHFGNAMVICSIAPIAAVIIKWRWGQS